VARGNNALVRDGAGALVPVNATVVVELPGDGLEWAAATQQAPGSRVACAVEGVHLVDGKYAVTTLVRASGFPRAALGRVVEQLKARYGAAAIEVVEEQAGVSVLRTRLAVDALQSPFIRFILRFYDEFKSVTASIEGGRLEVRGVPRVDGTAEQDAMRIRAFLGKVGTGGGVRVDRAVPAPTRP
jgi:hypothetical protein